MLKRVRHDALAIFRDKCHSDAGRNLHHSPDGEGGRVFYENLRLDFQEMPKQVRHDSFKIQHDKALAFETKIL